MCYRNEWGEHPAETLIEHEIEQLLSQQERTLERPVLVLDQFEDVFKLRHSRAALWDKLAELVNVPDSPIRVLISMREEWIGAWGESASYLPDGLRSVVRLVPLAQRELASAITHPAAMEGSTTVDAELVKVMLEDLQRPSAFGMGEKHVEPGLLQLVCHRLWEEAQQQPDRRMSLALYERLGRADSMCRNFVWDELGDAGGPKSRFSTSDRVLWVGMTRHLVVAQGIKAIADSKSMAQKLRAEDLGFAGPAVVQACLPKEARAYLQTMPERRGEPPAALVDWIDTLVSKAVAVGFLKQQRGADSSLDQSASQKVKPLFEISHDALGDMFQQFCVEFEGWLRGRWAKLVGALYAGLIIAPFVVYQAYHRGMLQALVAMAFIVVGGVAYLAVLVVLVIIMEWLFRLIGFPIVRHLARGCVPVPVSSSQPPSFVDNMFGQLARRLGFAPK